MELVSSAFQIAVGDVASLGGYGMAIARDRQLDPIDRQGNLFDRTRTLGIRGACPAAKFNDRVDRAAAADGAKSHRAAVPRHSVGAATIVNLREGFH